MLDSAELAGSPGPGGELAALAPLVSAVAQPIAARRHGAGWRPWLGPPRARDLLCLAGIALSGLYGLAMITLTPALIATRPVLLELLSGSTSSIMAAGAFADLEGKLRLTVVIAAALPGLVKFDLLFWCAGVLWGHRVVQMLARRSGHAAAFARQAEQRGPRFAGPAVLLAAFLPVPAPLVYAAAGWAGLRLVPFIILDLIGSAAWAALLAVLGYLLGTRGVAAANLVSHYALASIVGLTGIAIAPHAWHALRSRRASLARARAGGSAQRQGENVAMAATLAQILLAPDTRPKVVADCCTLIEQEVSERSGISGTAVKLAYKTVSTFLPGHVRHMVGSLLPQLADQLEPYWADFGTSGGSEFGDYLAKRGEEVARALLSVTDARAAASGRPTVIKAYGAVRGNAARHVEAALPHVGELVLKYAP